MEHSGYLISITTDTATSELPIIKLLFKSGGHSLVGTGGGSDNKVNRTLYITQAHNKTGNELTNELKKIPGVREITIVPISNPIKKSELSDIRELYVKYNYDPGGLSDNELSLYLNSHLKGEYTYVLFADAFKNEKGLMPLRFRRTQEVLDEHKNDPKPKIISETKRVEGDAEIHEVVVQFSEIISEPPPSPPPAAPDNLSKMTDAEIKEWYLKNNPRKLKAENIQIIRTANEIIITEKYKGERGTVRYKIK